MAIVTLAQAHAHLRLTWTLNASPVDARQADLELKLAQADAAILEYLNGRLIASSSVASPTVITTYGPHGFANSSTVIIAGHADSVPDLNGSHTMTYLSSDSFTIPVAVTTAGTGGRATVSGSWTDVTAPKPVPAAVLLLLTHLYEQRGDDMKTDEDLWAAIGRLLARTRDPVLA